MEDGVVPFTPDRYFRMDLMIPVGEVKEATMSIYRHKGQLIDLTYAELQAVTHL